MNNNVTIPEQYRPLSPWAYIGYQILFGLPLIGIIMVFVFAFSNENLNRRNYARSYLYMMALALGIAIIVGIFIAIFAVVAGGTVSSSTNGFNIA